MNRKSNNVLIILLVIVILALVYIIVDQKFTENVIAPEKELDKTNEISTDINKLTSEEQEIISIFISENISKLSPEKEVLGGKFYITSIDFIDSNNLIVGYEDGHIALIAEIEFEYLGSDFVDEEGNNKIIEIKKFDIISE